METVIDVVIVFVCLCVLRQPSLSDRRLLDVIAAAAQCAMGKLALAMP